VHTPTNSRALSSSPLSCIIGPVIGGMGWDGMGKEAIRSDGFFGQCVVVAVVGLVIVMGTRKCGAVSILVTPCMRVCMDTDEVPRVGSF
jgi:hypothetical protein